MNKIRRQLFRQRKQRIERRLKPRNWVPQAAPLFKASNELSDRDRGLAVGGIGAMHRLVRHVGLIEEIDEHAWRRSSAVARFPTSRSTGMSSNLTT